MFASFDHFTLRLFCDDIGVGQIIDARAEEKLSHEWTLNQARQAGNELTVKELSSIAPYPDADGTVSLPKLGIERKWSLFFGELINGRNSYDTLENTERPSPDYTKANFKAIDAGSAFTLPNLLSGLMSADFIEVRGVPCPILIFAGRYDYTTRSAHAKRWFDDLKAPAKRFVWFEKSTHMIYEEEPRRFLVHLVDDALPLDRDH